MVKKKKVVKKGSKKIAKKSNKKLVYDPCIEALSKFNIDGYREALKSAGYTNTILNSVDETVALNIKDLLSKPTDGYAKTTTFTSTTFDDIVAFPKFPVSKPGFHVVGKTNDVDLNEQVIKSFEPNDNLKILLEKEFAKPAELFNYLHEYDELNFEAAEKLLTDFKNRENIKEKLNSLKNIHNNDKSKFKRFEPIVSKRQLKELNISHNENQPTNRDKVNNSIDLFKKLAEKAGRITKEYWTAKHKFVMMNKFMEDFYAGKEFEEIEHGETIDFNEELNRAVELVDDEDSEYKKSILRKVRPDKYK